MFIRWHGYSCFEFADDRVRMVMDPHDGKSIGIWPPTVAANLVLCTHNNYDRNAFRVTYDRYHVIQHMSLAVDRARRHEWNVLREGGAD